MSRLTRDRTAEPVSRDKIFRRERGQKILIFPVQVTTCRIGNLSLAMDYARHAVWGMMYADDACIVSRSPHGLAKIMEVVVEVCRAFALTLSVKKTEAMYMPSPRTPRTMVRVKAAGQTCKQTQSVTHLRGVVTEILDVFVEIARRTRACWMHIRRTEVWVDAATEGGWRLMAAWREEE